MLISGGKEIIKFARGWGGRTLEEELRKEASACPRVRTKYPREERVIERISPLTELGVSLLCLYIRVERGSMTIGKNSWKKRELSINNKKG